MNLLILQYTGNKWLEAAMIKRTGNLTFNEKLIVGLVNKMELKFIVTRFQTKFGVVKFFRIILTSL